MERLKKAAVTLLAAAVLLEGVWIAALYKKLDLSTPDEADPPSSQGPSQPEEPVQKKAKEGDPTGRELLESHLSIAHALGPCEDWVGRNCLEGFEAAYADGTRIFEADICLTADGDLALRHDWGNSLITGYSPGWVSTLEEFKAFDPILGKYTPLSFRDLLELMDRYPDILVITDTKLVEQEAASTQLTFMVEEAREMGLLYVLDRMYIQLYNTQMYETARRVYDFPHYLLTLYASRYDGTTEMFTEFADFCAENGIEGITMWGDWWKPEYREILEERGLRGYVHTVNDAAEAGEFLKQGVCGIYTDSLTEDALKAALAG